MNIKAVSNEDNDLSRFMTFVKGLDANIKVIEDDWGNMCGITLSNNFSGTISDSICFNFYDDGLFRAIIDTSEENKYILYKEAQNKEFRYSSLWHIIKIWWRAKFSY